jgi:hypothetical protein
MKVIWTDTAVLSFEYTIDYLIKKFGKVLQKIFIMK